MKVLVFLLVVIFSAFLLSEATTRVPPADLLFKNGNIYTVNDARPKAEAVAIKGDRIIFVGSNGEAQKYVGRNTRVIDLAGRTYRQGR